jgi:LuxR family maltose regulon positive regulatory protein
MDGDDAPAGPTGRGAATIARHPIRYDTTMVATTVEPAVSGDLDYFRQSKIALPVTTLMSRPRIVAAIEEGVRGKLTVLSAPAGWGKSTALGEWSGTTW